MSASARSRIELIASGAPVLPAPASAQPIGKATAMFDYLTLARHLVGAARRAAHRLRHHGRLRSRRRHAASLRRPHRCAAPRDAQHDRTGLGGQSGLVHPRRRRHFRRLAAALCRVLLRLLSRHVAGACSAHPAAGRHQVPQQEGSARLARDLGLAVLRFGLRAGADLRRRLRQSSAGRSLSFRPDAAHDL